MITLNSPYKTRPVRYLHLAEHEGWRIKVYGIRYSEDGSVYEVDRHIAELAQRAMLSQLPLPAITDSRYGIGFLIIHQGQHRNWLLLDWWYDQEILKQLLFSSPIDQPDHITPAESDLLACTWELAIHGFERQAWIDHVLNNPAGPDIEGYLGQVLNKDV